MYDFKGFYKENRDYIIAFIVVFIACVAGAWLCYDYGRNKPVYNDTNTTMADLESRIDHIEQRVTAMQGRLEQAQQTLNGISERVSTGGQYANQIATGLGTATERLDSAIQRSGRIQNIIVEIENANRQGKANP